MAFFGFMSKLLYVFLVLSCEAVCIHGQSNEVSVQWGLADSTATVGKLFHSHIPSDAFSGTVLSYSVQKTDGSPLPNWLEFDAKNTVLQGIPTPEDAGQIYLEITAHGENNQASVTSTIYVRDISSHSSGGPLKFKTSGPEFVWCKEAEPETIATLIVDADFGAISASDRVDLLKKFASHMGLHDGMVKMVPVGGSPLHDSSALVSGTGDSSSPTTPGLFISWPVGCGQVKEGHFPVLQKLDEDSTSGRMANVLGHPVIGWQVTNTRFQAPTRKRRQVQSTPTLPVTMPTKTDTTDSEMTHKLIDNQFTTFIQPTATQPPMMKTDELQVTSPKVEDKTRIMPTEAVPPVVPVTRTEEIPPIKPTKTHDPLKPTDTHIVDVYEPCEDDSQLEVKNPIPVLDYYPGNIIDYVIPENTFEDCNVDGTRGLVLVLYYENGEPLSPESFLQFDSEKQKIVGLPMAKDTGHHTFVLTARNKANMGKADTRVHVHVNEGKKLQITHEFSVVIDANFSTFNDNVLEKVNLANKVASLYGDTDASNLHITKIQSGSVVFGWANSSLESSDCPVEDINDLINKLTNEDGSLRDSTKENMKPYKLQSFQAQPAGTCKGNPDFVVVDTKTKDKGDMEEVATSENVAKGSKGGESDDDIWITTVVPAVIVVVILLIALLIACILYRRKRKGKMNVEEQNTFINKGAPVIFPDELEEKPSDINKPLLVEGSPAPPPEYHRGTSESPDRQDTGTYRNLSASTPADDGITEMPEQPYMPPPPVTASTNGKQPRPAHQQQPLSPAPNILP